jgi:hypothetical protein
MLCKPHSEESRKHNTVSRSSSAYRHHSCAELLQIFQVQEVGPDEWAADGRNERKGRTSEPTLHHAISSASLRMVAPPSIAATSLQQRSWTNMI